MPSKADAKKEKEKLKEKGQNGLYDDEELEAFYRSMPVTDDISCGFGWFKGDWMQKLANKKVFIALYGLTGCCLSSTFAYFNGTITTIEKRFKIPSRTTGIISIGNDITQLFASVLLSYYGGRGHRPRWIAIGLYCVAAYCFLTATPHFLYGPGEDALLLTVEYGNGTENGTFPVGRAKNALCLPSDGPQCETHESNLAPQALLFIAQLISGIGGTLYYSLGFAYMDDNIKKSKSPVIISFSYFIRTLGPPMGYSLVSACLKLYIEPDLTPTINNLDPRWLGAWWLGWIIQGCLLIVFGTLMAFLPKSLPRAAARKELIRQKSRDSRKIEADKPSVKDMVKSLKKVLSNKIYLFSHISSIFYVFGYMPYWIFLPKYIEIQYRQSASTSSFVTGVVGLVCSALGILASGIVIQKFKPKAKHMAGWNVFIGFVSLSGIISYTYLGCNDIDRQMPIFDNGNLNTDLSCNAHCDCSFVKYTPVCGDAQTYISACHAGCTGQMRAPNGTTIYTNCACVGNASNAILESDQSLSSVWLTTLNNSDPSISSEAGGFASSGPCKVDCLKQFYLFLGIVCLLKFSGATGRLTSFLVSVRCVEEKDKALSIGIGMTAMSLFALVPSPITFGYIMDTACLVWGKTCTGTGNCWLFNAEQLRYKWNLTSAVFLAIAAVFDFGVYLIANTLDVYEENVGVIPQEDEVCDEKGLKEEDEVKTANADLESSEMIEGTNKVRHNI